jgi:type IVB pilus formation R64 PilN family outer membrane protein
MKPVYKRTSAAIMLALFASSLTGCAVGQQAKIIEADTTKSIRSAPEPTPTPVISTTAGAWLMGQSIKVVPLASPILSLPITYASGRRISLADLASYITLETHLVIDVSEVTQPLQTGLGASSLAPGMTGMAGMPPIPPMPTMQNPQMPGAQTTSLASQQSLQSMQITYEGTVSGLLDIAANKASVWWKYVDGKVVFYRTETKTFYLPTNARKSSGNSTIATTSSGGTSTGTGASTASTSGATVTTDYTIDFWGDVDKTAKAVGLGANVVSNASVGSVSVTGTPAQVRAVEEWVKGLNEQLSQQVAITLHMYTVKITKEETYNWDPVIIFKKTSGNYGLNLTPSTPLAPLSGVTPFGIAASVLSTATGATAQYSGSQAALQALSTLGNVSEKMQQSVVTMYGQPAPIQIANQRGYLASSSTTLTPNVGSTSTLTPGTVTTGVTVTFLPRVVNGKIILNMTMTNSSLIGISSITSSSATIQTTNVDTNTFQYSVSLTPGDALTLTGLQQENSAANNSGVGSATNAMLGGGVNNNVGKTMIAIVVSAKVL